MREREHTSQAPPPATIFLFLIARLTIIIASCRLRSTSAMNCSAPPLSTRVHVFALGQPSKKLKRSPPIWRSSKRSHVPRCSGRISEQVEDILPPVAWTTRSRSADATRPAQKTSRSAKYLDRSISIYHKPSESRISYCVAKSPIGSLLSTTFAPVANKASILL